MEQIKRRRSSKRAARLAVPIALAAAGIGLASAMVWTASNAAFTATTSNGVNSFNTGNVAISDDDSASVMYNAQTLVPGASAEVRCINVTYSGSIASPAVALYATSPAQTLDLDQYVDVVIEYGTATGNTFPNCGTFTPIGGSIYSGTLEDFSTNNIDHTSGVGSWSPTTGQSRVYRFTVSMPGTAPGTIMGGTASVTFVWEAKIGT